MDWTGIIGDVLSWLCLAFGSLLLLVTGIGQLRLPTFYTRIHAASISDTMGAGLVLLGLVFQSGDFRVIIKLILVLVFLVLTGPAAAHALAKAAYLHGVTPYIPDEEDGEHG